jgi:8-hydroxy-5-deazaflavin:NADPH oxidoreductase
LLTPWFRLEAFVAGTVQSQLLKRPLSNSLLRIKRENRNNRKRQRGHRTPERIKQSRARNQIRTSRPSGASGYAAKWGEIIILAVPHENAKDAIENVKPYVEGKTVIDVMNAIGENMDLGISCTTSSAEETQRKLPKAKVVKAFNTVFAKNQSTAKVGGEKLTAFIAGDDQKAKQTVAQLTRDIGFDPIDCGPLKSARYLEAMAILIINLAFTYKMGTDIGYKLAKA